MKKKTPVSVSPSEQVDKACAEQTFNRLGSYPRYLYERLRRAKLFLLWQRALVAFRRMRLVVFLTRTAVFAVTLIETGAFVLLTTVLFLILLPLFLLTAVILPLAAFFCFRAADRKLAGTFDGRQVFVFFSPNNGSTFFSGNVRDLVSHGGTALLVVPSGLFRKGLFRGWFLTARQEESGIYLVRRSYYFHIKKRLLRGSETVFFYG